MKREIGWLLGISLTVLVVLLVGNNHWHRFARHNDTTGPTSGPDYTATPATWSGRQACVECHAEADSLWQLSDHARAMQEPSPETITADFNQATFTHYGVTSTFSRDGDRYLVNTDGPDGQMTTFDVAYVFGYYPLEQFLIEFPDGRLQALNVCWDSRPLEEGGQRWFHLYPDDPTPATDLFHWTGVLQNWNYMCAECHSTNLRRNYDPVQDTYQTRWFEINVSCEACHGPGSRHILWEKAEAQKLRPANSDGKRGLVVNLKSPDQGIWIFEDGKNTAVRSEPLASRIDGESCAHCHARRSALTEEYEWGKPFADHHRLRLLEENYYHADGQNQDEVYVWGSFLQSKMHAAGVTCSDCHDYHTGKVRGDGHQVCSQCHRAEFYDSPDHHFHQLGKGGDSCLDCHQQSRNLMVVDGRRDHSFRIPRPDLSLELGTPNACSDCHTDQTVQWSQDAIVKWYGPDRLQGPHYAIALHAGRTGSPGALDKLRFLIGADDQPAIARATALSLIPRFALASQVPEVRTALDSDEDLMRAAAVRALESSSPEERLSLGTALLDDEVFDVRLAAARLLARLPADRFDGMETQKARRLWEDHLNEFQERPENMIELAGYFGSQGQWEKAEEYLQRAIALEPRMSGPYLNLAEVKRQLGQPRAAQSVLEEGLEKATEPADLHHSLGLFKVRQGDMAGAVPSLQRAATMHPGIPRYGYVLAVALHDTGQREESLIVLEEVLKEHTWENNCLQAHVMYALESGDPKRALGSAQKLVQLAPQNPQAQQWLATIQAWE